MQEKYRWLAGKLKKGEIVMEGHKKIRILLADDSITIRRVVEMTLPQDKFQITSVGDGEAALEVLANELPDVILADVIMPKMDGYALCSVIRSSPQFMNIPVILLVGTFENYDETRGKECGANDHIVKPFETGDLIEKISKLAERSEATPAPIEEMTTDAVVEKEVAVERGAEVEFAERESVAMEEHGTSHGVVDSFETLAEVPGHHEYCNEGEPCPAPEQKEAVAAVAEAASGDENFPWEEEIDLPSTEEAAPVVAEPPVAEESPALEEEHVFSLADLKPDMLETLEKGEELPAEAPFPEAEVLEESARVEEIMAAEEEVPLEETASVVEEIPVEQEASAAQEVETVEAVPAPAALSGDSLQALQESIEKTVRDAVLSAFGDFFREAVEKAAREVVPGLVEKAIREELDRRGT
ncbi:MAG: response regulator [Nitrospirota bacterium]|nr:response regulator [Nitrospirota bacterium]